MATKTKQAIKPLMQADSVLTAEDIKLLQRREKIEAELKKLDADLKPRIKATIDEYGEGLVELDGHTLELKRSKRSSCSWQSLATALLDEAVIDEQKPAFTVTHDIDSCKVVR